MKKLACVLLLFSLVCISLFSFAENSDAAVGSADIVLNGESLSLFYDDNPMITNDSVEVCFYTDTPSRSVDLYIVFPISVEDGTEVTPQSCMEAQDEESGLFLFDTVGEDTRTSLATQDRISIFPEGSDYRITFQEVSREGTAITIRGIASATLAVVDEDYYETGALDEITVDFYFTADTNAAENSEPDYQPTPDAEEPERYKI